MRSRERARASGGLWGPEDTAHYTWPPRTAPPTPFFPSNPSGTE